MPCVDNGVVCSVYGKHLGNIHESLHYNDYIIHEKDTPHLSANEERN